MCSHIYDSTHMRDTSGRPFGGSEAVEALENAFEDRGLNYWTAGEEDPDLFKQTLDALIEEAE